MLTISRLAASSVLALLTVTLTSAAYARGGGHSGFNGSAGSSIHSSGPVHMGAIRAGTVHSSYVIVSKHGGKTTPAGSAAYGGGSQITGVVVRDHRGPHPANQGGVVVFPSGGNYASGAGGPKSGTYASGAEPPRTDVPGFGPNTSDHRH